MDKRYLFQNKIYYLDKISLFLKNKAFQIYSVQTKLVTRPVKNYRVYATQHKNEVCSRLIYEKVCLLFEIWSSSFQNRGYLQQVKVFHYSACRRQNR